MTKSGAINAFWNSFGLDAYPTSSIPEDEVFPYISYENTTGNAGDDVSVSVNLWFHTSSEVTPNAKAEEIAEDIGLGGKVISYDGGWIWIKRGTPWCISQSDQNDPQIKLRKLNIELSFM